MLYEWWCNEKIYIFVLGIFVRYKNGICNRYYNIGKLLTDLETGKRNLISNKV